MVDPHLTFTQTRESLDFALESGKMATWEFDLNTNQVTCSIEMLRLWGIEPQEFSNNRSILQSKVHPEDLEEMRSRIQAAIKDRSVYEFEYRIIPRPGELRWVRSRGRCTSTSAPGSFDRFAGIVYDITEQKLREIELANAIKARSDFLSVAGHELKTPLTCMQLHLQVLESQLRTFPATTSMIENLTIGLKKQQDYLQRISMIVDNILDEAKISEGLFALTSNPAILSSSLSESSNK